jgi:hypothetical protein
MHSTFHLQTVNSSDPKNTIRVNTAKELGRLKEKHIQPLFVWPFNVWKRKSAA